MSETKEEYRGVMDASYAQGRQTASHLKYRLKVRAQLAVNAFREMGGDDDAPRVLELGAADGLTLLKMRELLGGRGEYVGVEYAQDLIDAWPVVPGNVSVQQGDVMALSPALRDGSWDLVTALAVLEHLSDPGACVRGAFEALAPGGVFVATCPNPFWDGIAGKLKLVEDDFHEIEVDRNVMLRLAREAGFAHFEYRPFMWVVSGSLPYLGWGMDADLSLDLDEIIGRLPGTGLSFVNQALIAVKE